jgi:hypothetical protein
VVLFHGHVELSWANSAKDNPESVLFWTDHFFVVRLMNDIPP